MRALFAVLVAVTIFHVVHGDMRPSRPQKTGWELAGIKLEQAEGPDDVLILRPKPPLQA